MSSPTEPVLRKVDISASPAVLTVATTLRRLWLVDPSSPVLAEKLAKAIEEESDNEHEHEHEHDHSNCSGHDHAHEADLDNEEHDHTNCSGHDHSHAHTHKEGDEAESDHDDESSCGCGHAHDDLESEYLHQVFPIALTDIAAPIGEEADPNNDVYDDAKWIASTDLVLIDPPTGYGNPIQVPPGFASGYKGAHFHSKEDTAKPDETKDEAAEQSKDTDKGSKPAEPKDADAEEEEDSDNDDAVSSPLFTPFRQQIYRLYNHVFFDAHSSLKAQLASAEGSTEQVQIGDFKYAATTMMVLEAPEEDEPEKEKGIPHEFETDTFVYPVWIARGTKLTIKREGETETMVEFTDEGKKWTEVLWFKAGTKVVVHPESEDSKANGVVALLCLGACAPVGEGEGGGEGEGAADGAEMH
ncbi:hypothetical protein V8F06_004887 [Rhypophila decipiens]